ncbi:hypothetical protein [Thiothrix subterranea]|uniref:hypothetical protein n=1 Tax=Thiothrix subterranea TaxID=2735563 RepID=UPI00280B12F2|nr:hypothetical protein [Thiothrix subterranea]
MMWCNIDVRKAIATSAGIGLPIAIAGTVGYLVNGWGQVGLPDYTIGFVYWPAVLLIALTSFSPRALGQIWRIPCRWRR